MGSWIQDTRVAIRTLRKTPSVTLVAIVALSLAIGSTTTVFSVVKGILIEPLPFEQADRLVTIFQYDPASPGAWRTASQGSFVDSRRSSRSFEKVTAGRNRSFTLSGFEDGDTPLMREISHGYFEVLGVQPLLGRTFLEDEDRPGGPRVLMLSYELWQRRFGGDPGVIGRTTDLDGEPFEIVGVMPQDYSNIVWGLNVPPQAWLPLALPESGLDRRGNAHLVFARLKDDVTIEQAQAEMTALAATLREAYPEEHRNVEFVVTPAKERIVRNIRPMLMVLFGAVGFVLLVACGNVANLLLTRAVERRREIAVRRALGAGTGHILRQLLTESVVLAVGGGILGALFSLWGVESVQLLIPAAPGTPSFDLSIDGSVLLFALLVSIGTGLLFGLAPVYHATRSGFESDLAVGATRSTADGARQRLRGGLVVAEVALSLVLLIGAGLMLDSFARLQGLNPGFDPENVLTFRVSTRGPAYVDGAARTAFFQGVADEIAKIPGVIEAGLSQFNPMFSGFGQIPVRLSTDPLVELGSEPRVAVRRMIPGFLRALGVPLLRGRLLDERDVAGSAAVAVVSRTLARQLFGDRDPLGESLTILDGQDVPRQIVGIVGDVRSAATPPLPDPILYLPLGQDPVATSALVVMRTRGDPKSHLLEAQAAVRNVDRSMPVYLVQTMPEVIARMDVASGMLSSLLTAFAVLALALAVTGMYGVLSYLVSQRTREFGIRIALGAQRTEVVTMVLRGALRLGSLGVVVGLAGAVVLSQALESQLFGVSATEPRVYASLVGLLVTFVLISSLIPALRATRVDPTVALREE